MNDAKTKIMKAASDLFLEGGSKALSVRAIARQAGLSTIGIYSHFEGKQGILDALYIEGFALLEAAMVLPRSNMSRHDAVEALTRQYVRNALTHEAHYRLIFGDQRDQYKPSSDAIAASRRTFSGLLDQTAHWLPELDSDDVHAAALEIWALIHGFVSLRHYVKALEEDPAAWEDRVVRAVQVHMQALSP